MYLIIKLEEQYKKCSVNDHVGASQDYSFALTLFLIPLKLVHSMMEIETVEWYFKHLLK